MGLKILHSADWHLDSPFAGFSEIQRAFLREESLKIPRKIADLCRRENCDLILLSGDLFDGPYRKATAEIVKASLADCAVPVCIAPGNHDFLSPASPWVRERWPENVHIFRKGLSSLALPELNCRVWGAGYDSMDCPPLLEGFRAEGPEAYQLAVLHGDPTSASSPYCPVTVPQVRDSGFSYLALGHIHKAGSFRAGNTLCSWPGVPMGRGWDETGEKGVYIAEIGQQSRIRFLPMDTPRFFDLESEEDMLAQTLPSMENDHFYRITLTGSGETPLGTLAQRYAHLPNLTWTDRRQPRQDPWLRAGEDTLEGIYFRLLKKKLETAAPEDAGCIRLAAELSQQILEGQEVVL